ncbi:MAG: DUF2062 domain-containing protein [Chthoniobacterales bacterium]
MPRLKTMRGSWLHRRVGDRLLDHKLWQPDREAVARGLAIGTFFSMLPVPMQMLPAAVTSILARANVPCAIVACWITNPITAPVFLVLQIQIGFYLLGKGTGWRYLLEHGAWDLMLKAPLPLFVGAVVSGLGFAVIAYFCGLGVFDWLTAFLSRNAKRRHLLLGNRSRATSETVNKDALPPTEQLP